MVRTAAVFLVGGLIGAAAMLWLDDAGRDSTGAARRPGGDAGIAADRGLADATLAGLEEIASRDPSAALGDAMAIDDALLVRRAIEGVAAAWVARDPLAAIAGAERLPPHLRLPFMAAIDAEWARLDAEGYFAHLETDPSFLESLTGEVAIPKRSEGPARQAAR